MSNSFFFMSAEKTETNSVLVDELVDYSEETSSQAYVLDRPLGDQRYNYNYDHPFVLLTPKHKIIFVNFGLDGNADFEGYQEDFIEDLGSIADKYRYKDFIGRPRTWRTLISAETVDPLNPNLQGLLDRNRLNNPGKERVVELLISLLTGSINDIEKIGENIPDNILDKVKKKILLFDGDQTRFIYQKVERPTVRIQGLSGTGKTELLLHKLKELYTSPEKFKIFFTCHNKILADNLKRRIPEFFNFMKVEQQIKWNERLWCTNAWGSKSDKNSGAYAFICASYGLAFHPLSSKNFNDACSAALEQMRQLHGAEVEPVFDYMLIDESQDFSQSFFDLCQAVTKYTVYIAGDIFQNIFSTKSINNARPDFLLSKCYRTDPRTLMFSHALGMGLFEERKLQWLEDLEWQACGYIVEKDATGSLYRLKREPLRRFEDLDNSGINSTEIVLTNNGAMADTEAQILGIIEKIQRDNPTAQPDDIGIIFLDNGKDSFTMADQLELSIPRRFGWEVNKAYETRTKKPDKVFISHRNHVKGLEFPFVICIAGWIGSSYSIRNSLYMIMTRSFIQTYLLIHQATNQALINQISLGLSNINVNGCLEVSAPSAEEIELIKTKINIGEAVEDNVSFYDFVYNIFDELLIYPIFRTNLYETVKRTAGENFDRDLIRQVAEFNYGIMLRERNE